VVLPFGVLVLPDAAAVIKEGDPGILSGAPGSPEHDMHVLDIESATYEMFVTAHQGDLLPGCRCAFCSGMVVRLTAIRVARKLNRGVGDFVVLAIALARCGTCHHRERVLPCDVLPGKVTGVAVIFAAVIAVEGGEGFPAVARRYGVCALTIRLWQAGLGARALDLVGLMRHRAMVAPAAAPPVAVLVGFGCSVPAILASRTLDDRRDRIATAVMAPGTHTYLDHYQAAPEKEPLAIGGNLPLNKVYEYEPIPAALTADEARHVRLRHVADLRERAVPHLGARRDDLERRMHDLHLGVQKRTGIPYLRELTGEDFLIDIEKMTYEYADRYINKQIGRAHV
jgi:hypothetical protein